MPICHINGANLWYEEDGHGPETLVFSHGLLMDHRMFQGQAEVLGRHYRCIRYDHRGQGRSEVTLGGYDMDSLAEDAAGLIRSLGCAPCHFAGLSMGGFVGLRLAIRHPELLRSLTLIATSAEAEPAANRMKYRTLAALGRVAGFRILLGRIMPLMFGTTYLADPDRRAERDQWRQHLASLGRTGTLRALPGVIGRGGVTQLLDHIKTRTLILVGEEDRATPVARSIILQNGIAGSRMIRIPRAGHSPTIETPGEVSRALLEFLRAA